MSKGVGDREERKKEKGLTSFGFSPSTLPLPSPFCTCHAGYLRKVVVYWRIQPPGAFSEKRSRHIYLMEDNNFIIAYNDMYSFMLSLQFFVYSYFEKGCRKKCTPPSLKVLWVVFSSLFFKEIWKNGTSGRGYMSASAKGKQYKKVRQLQCQEQSIDHIPYYLSGMSPAHFSHNLSRNSCILNSTVKAAL